MIQLYAKVADLTPTEDKWVEPAENHNDLEEAGHFHYTDWINDIQTNGMQYCLKVHPNGLIADGNFRYWCAKDLGMEYVPIDFFFYMGLSMNEYLMSIRSDFPIPRALHGKLPVITQKHMPVVLGHGNHPYCTIDNLRWVVLK